MARSIIVTPAAIVAMVASFTFAADALGETDTTTANPASNVISINICQGTNGTQTSPALIGHIDVSDAEASYPTIPGVVPAKAWCCLDSQKGGSASSTATTAWDGLHQKIVEGQAVSLNITCGSVNNFSYDVKSNSSNVYTPDYLRMWLSQRNGGTTTISTFSVSQIPYSTYSIYVYFAGLTKTGRTTVNDGKAFLAITFNGTSYTCASDGTATAGTDAWGDCTYCTTGVQLGTNVMKFSGVTGTTFNLSYTANDAGIAAIQVVDEGSYDYEQVEVEDGDRPTASVYSFTICQGTSHVGHIGSTHNPLYTLCGWLPASAWSDPDREGAKISNYALANYWDATAGESKTDGVITATHGEYPPNNGYDNNADAANVYAPDYLREWYAKKDNSAATMSMDFAQIPYSRYSVILYLSGITSKNARTTVNEGKAFSPVTINGAVAYTWDDLSLKTVPGDSDWGDCTYAKNGYTEGQTAGVAYGKNALRIDNLTGSTFSFSYLGYAAGVAAIQFIDQSVALEDDALPIELAAEENVPVSGAASTVTTPNGASSVVKKGAGTLTVTSALGYPLTVDAGTVRLLKGVEENAAITAAEGAVVELVEQAEWDGVTPAFTFSGAGTLKIIGLDGVERKYKQDSSGSCSFTPSIFGGACLYDFGFTNTLANAGTAGGAMAFVTDGTDGFTDHYKNGTALYTGSHPGVGSCFGSAYPAQWTAVAKGKIPGYANAIFVSFGKLSGGALALATGSDLSSVMLVRTTGDAAYETLATIKLIAPIASEHLFVLTVKSQTEVELAIDERKATTKTVTLSSELGYLSDGGLRVGSLRDGVGDTGLVQYTAYGQVASGEETRSYVGTLRLFSFVLGANARAALASELGVFQPGFLLLVQ